MRSNLPARVIGIAALFLAFAMPVSAQEAVADTTMAPTQPFSVLQAVQKGREMLKALVAERSAAQEKPAILSAKPSVAVITLAIWEKGTATITLVDAEKSGTDVRALTPGNWPLRVTYNNRQLSQYSLPASRNATVVGVRYPAAIEHVQGKKKTYEIRDTVFVPYLPEFYVPEVLTAGSDYLSYLIQDAFDELREKGITSRAYPDRLVADVIDPYLIKSVAVIEHSDYATLMGETEPERALGRFLVKLALNHEDAFDTALSRAGAAGLVQFIPSTYDLYVKRRPDLGLIPDFRAGMADHKNAIKAEVAYLDQSLASMPAPIKALYATDKMTVGEFLAAAYNGGEARVKKAYATYGAVQWPTGLRKETAQYVAKLKKTYALLAAGAFATPSAPSGALPTVAVRPSSPTSAAPGTLAVNVICFGDGGCRAL